MPDKHFKMSKIQTVIEYMYQGLFVPPWLVMVMSCMMDRGEK